MTFHPLLRTVYAIFIPLLKERLGNAPIAKSALLSLRIPLFSRQTIHVLVLQYEAFLHLLCDLKINFPC